VAFTDDAEAKATLNGCYDKENVAKIKNIIDNYGIKEIRVKGWASSHGITINQTRNNDLNRNRRETALQWLKNCSVLRNKKISYKPLNGSVGPGPAASNVSDLKPKLYRCAEVTVYINTEKANTAQDIVKEKTTRTALNSSNGVLGATINDELNTTSYLAGHTEVPDKTRVAKQPILNTNFQNQSNNGSKKGLKVVKSATQTYSKNGNTNGAAKANTNATKTTTKPNDANVTNVKDHSDNKGAEVKASAETASDNTVRRYDNESDFFKGLAMNDPIMRNKITEKVKYFDPAFHSISPEGFNARLNFLHQCTRQGPTIAGSDLSDAVGVTANNLSFGRPPICVLRIGDFYYTKIVITSMSIDYDPLSWDLNHEGIGVMPMFANISLNFHFIGGSSLAGPIARLQNALSFNYYANSEVYDDRAEQVDYDENGAVTKFKTFPY
jgi:hypothetical protein